MGKSNISGSRIRRGAAAGIFLLFLSACSGTPVEDYIPKDPNEKEILSAVVRYLSARKVLDVDGLLGCLHDQGRYHFAHWRSMTKSQLQKRLPQFWNRLKSGDQRVFPMVREDLTGDFFLSGRYVDPRMVIHGDKARVSLTFSVVIWGSGHDISLCRENGRWWIDGLSWQQN